MSSLFQRLQDELDSQDQPGGLSPVDLLSLPAELGAVMKKMVRRNGLKLTEIAETLAKPPQEAQKILDELVQKGYVRRVEVKEEIWYKVRFAQKRSRTVSSSLWAALDDVVQPKDDPSQSP